MDMKRCRLCGRDRVRLAEAHVFAVGFFAELPEKAHVKTVALSDGSGRRLPKALYDREIICDECEHGIMQPLDDYAIKVIRDKKGAFRVPLPPEAPMGMFVFEGVNKRRIRAFLASVLWRCSVSRQPELNNLSIGNAYEERIRHDMLNNGDFSFVDMLLRYLTHPVHSAFVLPTRTRLEPIDTNRDSQRINGWKLAFPNVVIRVSLDRRPHPGRMFFDLATDLTGRKEHLLASTSLAQDADAYQLLAFESVRDDSLMGQILKAVAKMGIGLHNKPSDRTR